MFLGIDLGTSSVKVLLTDLSGNILGESSVSYGAYGLAQGFFEQSPTDWTESIVKAVHIVKKSVSAEQWQMIVSIGLSAQMPTMVLTDRQGHPLDRAIVWCDNRADAQARQQLARWGKDRHYGRTGVKLDGRYLVPMYQWIMVHKPELLQEAYYLLSAKDYLCFWLSGKPVTDPSTASGYGVYNLHTMDWDYDLCREANLAVDCLPEIMDSSQSGLTLQKEVGSAFGWQKEIALCVGAADSVAGVLGMGAMEAGTVCQICGSSTAIIGLSNEVRIRPEDPFFITPMARKGSFGLEADILSTGSTSNWLATLLGINPEQLSALGQKAPPGSDGVIFAPYLAGGEQGVLWNPALSGGILGISLRHEASHMVRAHLEGICFEAKRCIDAFEKSGFPMQYVLLSGPVTKDVFYLQTMADILQRPCFVSAVDQASAYGAAMLAAICAGKCSWEGTKLWREKQDCYLPNPATAAAYEAHYDRYLAEAAKMER